MITPGSHTDPIVLIVGAGPVGLASALELARFGVRSIVLEKHPTTSTHPKTRNFNTRTMEITRGWGGAAYARFRAIDTPPGWKSPIRFFDTITGTEFGRIDSLGFEGPGPDISPAEPVMSSQELIEEIMLDAARASGLVEIRFSTEVTALLRGAAENDCAVALEVHDRSTGETSILEGAALVGADGASSFVRAAIGVELEGAKDLSHIVNCYFDADIEPLLDGRTGVLLWACKGDVRGVLQPLDAKGRWLCQINVDAADWTRDVFTDQRAIDWVRRAVGAPDLDITMRSIGFWKLNATVAQRFVTGRVLLVGDAAHQFPPTGGLGVNTGLQGTHNAMWKLAWHLLGRASWSLVETYDEERRPVSQRIVNQSLENSLNVMRIREAMEVGELDTTAADVIRESRRYGNHLGVEFGAVYSSSAVLNDDTKPPPVDDDYSDYKPSATPGARAPHHRLGQLDNTVSTIDLIGTGFTLLAAADGHAWIRAATQFGNRVPIDAYRAGGAGLDDLGDFSATYGVESSGAVLVRPDGHVAHRFANDAQATERLTEAVNQLLAAPPKRQTN